MSPIRTYKHALYNVISLSQLYSGIYKRYVKLSAGEILFNLYIVQSIIKQVQLIYSELN